MFDATGVQPYMFEPLANVNSEEIASDISSADDSSDEDTNRIGNADWYVDTFNLCIYVLAVGLDYRFTRFNISMTGASVGNVCQ